MQQNRITVNEFMRVNGIKSRKTVYAKIKAGLIDAVDINNGRGERASWRILVPRTESAVN